MVLLIGPSWWVFLNEAAELLGCSVRVDLVACHGAPFLAVSESLQVLWGTQSRGDAVDARGLQFLNTPGWSWRDSLAHTGQRSSGHPCISSPSL